MHINIHETLFFVLFKLTIFTLLVIQLYQITKQLLIPFLWEQIKLIEKIWKDLINKKNYILSNKKQIKKEIQNQKIAFENLEKKIYQWHSSLLEKQKKTKEESKQVFNLLQKKKNLQSINFSFMIQQKLTIPDAIKSAEKDLLKIYTNHKGKELVEKIIDKLQLNNTTPKTIT